MPDRALTAQEVCRLVLRKGVCNLAVSQGNAVVEKRGGGGI